jgi:hypothetical protein
LAIAIAALFAKDGKFMTFDQMLDLVKAIGPDKNTGQGGELPTGVRELTTITSMFDMPGPLQIPATERHTLDRSAMLIALTNSRTGTAFVFTVNGTSFCVARTATGYVLTDTHAYEGKGAKRVTTDNVNTIIEHIVMHEMPAADFDRSPNKHLFNVGGMLGLRK